MPRRTWIAALTTTLATAAAHAGDDRVREALRRLVPGATIEATAPAPMPGLVEAVLDGQIVYVSDDGRYALTGELWRIDGRRSLTEDRRTTLRRDALAALGDDRRIAFRAPAARHTVTVFTDFDCGYCQRLHRDVARYNELGIDLEYVLFPRGGPGSPAFERAVSVWCAEDRAGAFTAAKAGTPPPPRTCPNPVADMHATGLRVGVGGTPMLYAADGRMIGGYLTPEQLVERLAAADAR